MSETIQGRCNCGRITITVPLPLDPELANLCHCLDCRRSSGCPAAYHVRTPRSTFTFTGTPKTYTNIGESGMKVKRYFCGDCGSQLWDEGEIEPDEYSIKTGLFPPGRLPRPSTELFMENLEDWERPFEGAKGHHKQPLPNSSGS